MAWLDGDGPRNSDRRAPAEVAQGVHHEQAVLGTGVALGNMVAWRVVPKMCGTPKRLSRTTVTPLVGE